MAALTLRGRTFDAAHPAVMAIINRTTDSFYAPARHAELDAALDAMDDAVAGGADIVDIGAVRAGQEGERVSVRMEVERLTPFLTEARRRHPEVILSVDTWRSEVVRAVVPLDVDLVNDTWAGHDAALAREAAAAGLGLVCSHTGGLPPRTDPVSVTYPPEPDGVVADVVRRLGAAAQAALDAGIPRDRILLDPTLDFGKTTRHSLTLVRRTADVVALGFPVLQAISRKDFVGETLDLPADERLHGTLAATAVAAWLGATVFRTHDVRATRQTVDMVASILGARPPSLAVRGEPAEEEES
ncbi:MAG: dihydropteroate synthase [Nocardioides sp.]